MEMSSANLTITSESLKEIEMTQMTRIDWIKVEMVNYLQRQKGLCLTSTSKDVWCEVLQVLPYYCPL